MYFLKENYGYAYVKTVAKQKTHYSSIQEGKGPRIQSIDILRGLVMVIMAIDHVRDYFHRDSFLFSPTDLSQTNVPLFLTRWITHFCAPVFVFLAGISAYQYGLKKGKKALSFFLWTRGLWLIFVELFILSLFKTFNPTYPYFNLQVIWAIGVCMIVLAGIIQMNSRMILATAIVIIAGHNLLDNIHLEGNGPAAFIWSVLHQANHFNVGRFTFNIHYPLIPWIGLMTIGYYLGRLYAPSYNPSRRKSILLLLGLTMIFVFVNLRFTNWYGDPSHWSIQKSGIYTFLSFINVTKYPPSLLYILITIGPALIFLALTEKPLSRLSKGLTIFGRTAMFYYLAHLLLIHIFAVVGAVVSGYSVSDMILSTSVYDAPQLKGYGFNLFIVYTVWLVLMLVLFPLCKWFDQYKRTHVQRKWWLSYL
jgi:uncharacterized membrane protein